MLNLLIEAGTYTFPCGRALKLIKSTMNITNSTSPIILGTNLTLTVIECCSPAPLRLAAHCVAAGSLLTASLLTPNPITIGPTVHIIGEIYENC